MRHPARTTLPWVLLIAVIAVVAAAAAIGIAQSPSSHLSASVVTTPPPTSPSSSGLPTTSTLPASAPLPSPPQATGVQLRAVAFLSPEDGYGLYSTTGQSTCQTLVGRTTDGGVDMGLLVTVASGPCGSASLSQIAFDDHGDGFVYGPGLAVTHDGGATWSPSPQPGEVLSVEALGDSIWMVQADCPQPQGDFDCPMTLLQSSDGGWTWAPSPSMPAGADTTPVGSFTTMVRLSTPSAYLAAFPGPSLSATVRLWFTNDGGATWSTRSIPCATGAFAVALSAAPDGTLWAVCAYQPGAGNQEKTVMRSVDEGQSWTTELACNDFANTASQPCGAVTFGYLGSIDAVSSTEAFMVGDRLNALVSTDGGQTWQVVQPSLGGTDDGTLQVIFFDANHGLVLGYDSRNDDIPTIWSTGDGGAHWTAVVPEVAVP